MPASFLKALILTLLIVVQMQSIDVALSYVQNTGLPKELFVLIGAGVLYVGVIVYRLLAKRIVGNHKLAH